jgi:hypothetical protein
MPEIDGVITVVREWVVKADSDLTAAAALLRLKDGCPTDVVCFHAQQKCGEISQGVPRVRKRRFSQNARPGETDCSLATSFSPDAFR